MNFRLAEYLIKGQMLIPENSQETLNFENEIWEYKNDGKTYRLVPAIEMEDENGNITYLDAEQMKKNNFEICSLNEANWFEM